MELENASLLEEIKLGLKNEKEEAFNVGLKIIRWLAENPGQGLKKMAALLKETHSRLDRRKKYAILLPIFRKFLPKAENIHFSLSLVDYFPLKNSTQFIEKFVSFSGLTGENLPQITCEQMQELIHRFKKRKGNIYRFFI